MEALTLDLGRYPYKLLAAADTALFLFGAGFLGSNDAGWGARHGVRGTVVDNDIGKLARMHFMYPDDWEFVCEDAFAFVDEQRAAGSTWDHVSVDPWSGDMNRRCLDMLPAILELATKSATVGFERGTSVECPEGWTSRVMLRASLLVDWLVLERT